MKKIIMSIAVLGVVALCACTPGRVVDKKHYDGDYWQRSDAVETLHLNGPKAQHQLNKDITACTVEVKELVRLGSIRSARPPQTVATNRQMAKGWNSVTRDGPLYTEYRDYTGFEGCMAYKGWRRMTYLTPQQVEHSAEIYNETILGYNLGSDDDDVDLNGNRVTAGFNN